MDLENLLLASGFDEASSKMIMADFFAGIGNVMQARSAASTDAVRDVLSEEEAQEILRRVIFERASLMLPAIQQQVALVWS